MRRIVDIAVSHARLTLAILIFLLVAGALAYSSIPKESQPDVQIPYIYVQLSDRGISPEDSERLLLRPMETELKNVSNLKTMTSAAFEGGGYVLLEFNAGFNSDVALQDVRAKVDAAKPNIPTDADQPGVYEVSLSLFPVISVALTGDIPERTLTKIATDLQTSIREAPGVLSADLRGSTRCTPASACSGRYPVVADSLSKVLAIAAPSDTLLFDRTVRFDLRLT